MILTSVPPRCTTDPSRAQERSKELLYWNFKNKLLKLSFKTLQDHNKELKSESQETCDKLLTLVAVVDTCSYTYRGLLVTTAEELLIILYTSHKQSVKHKVYPIRQCWAQLTTQLTEPKKREVLSCKLADKLQLTLQFWIVQNRSDDFVNVVDGRLKKSLHSVLGESEHSLRRPTNFFIRKLVHRCLDTRTLDTKPTTTIQNRV